MRHDLAALLLSACGVLCVPTLPAAAEPPVHPPAEASPMPGAPPAPAGVETGTGGAALRGPTVPGPRPSALTLVEREFNGKLKRLDTPAAEEAVRRMELTPQERAAVDAVILARSAAFDAVVRENILTLVKLQGAKESGDREGLMATLKELRDKAGPIKAQGKLIDRLGAALPPAKGKELRRAVDEYVRAAAEERAAEDGAKDAAGGTAGGTDAPMGGEAENKNIPSRAMMKGAATEALLGFGQELKRSYERVFGQPAKDFSELLTGLNVTPEQESKIRKLAQDDFGKHYGKAPAAERARLFREVYLILDEGQRKVLVERFADRK